MKRGRGIVVRGRRVSCPSNHLAEAPHAHKQLTLDRGMVVRGRLRGARIDLERPMDALNGDVEVSVRPVAEVRRAVADMLALLATFPPGTRTKDEIDRQVLADRAGWDCE